ncbi:MAG: histidine kinase [Bacteroidota bacterium]|nr:histidine kinase [Bacteroidota bacterium]MDP3145974.1 histidine kinase [Bacteroidota bacterium]
MKNNKSKQLRTQINIEVLKQLHSFSESLISGHFPETIDSINIHDEILNKIIKNIVQYSSQLNINTPEINAGNYDLSHFIEVITEYANHQFSNKLAISNQNTILDAIATGVNFLGEELEKTIISSDYFSAIFNSVDDLLIVFDSKGIIIDVNSATENQLDEKKENLIGKDLKIIMDLVFILSDANNKAFFDEEKKLRLFDAILYNKLGVASNYLCSVSIFNDNKTGHEKFLIIAKNVTEKKERDLKEMTLVINTIEKERSRLSDDMHDSLGQEINAVRLYLNTISCMDTNTDVYKQAIETCKTLLDNSVQSIRDICFDLMPKSLENGGFILACHELVVKLNQFCDIEYNFPNFEIKGSREIQIYLYRIIQEFLSNSIKHSGCSKIIFNIKKTKDKVQISIADNGIGFNIYKIKKGNGLYNIFSRIDVLQVKYDFKSETKKGTSLKLYIDN